MKEKPNIRFKWMHLSLMNVLQNCPWLAQVTGCRHLFCRALCWKHWSELLYYQYKIIDGSVWRLCLPSIANESCSRQKLPVNDKFTFIPSMAAEKLCIVLVFFFSFFTVTLYLSPSPSAAVAGAGASMTPRWRTSIRGTLCFLALCTVRCTSVGSSTAPAPGSVTTWM